MPIGCKQVRGACCCRSDADELPCQIVSEEVITEQLLEWEKLGQKVSDDIAAKLYTRRVSFFTLQTPAEEARLCFETLQYCNLQAV